MKTARQIEREFASLLQEGYANGYLTHSCSIRLTGEFLTIFGPLLDFLIKSPDAASLGDEAVRGLPEPAAGTRNYAHMQIFVTKFVDCITNDERWAALADECVDLIEKACPYRRGALDSIVGLGAFHLYEKRFPPPVENAAHAA